MQADDIYRFVTLRQPSPVPPGEPVDPFIGAYSHQSQPTPDSFRHKVVTALAEDDRITPRVDAVTLLESQDGRNAWSLIADTPYAQLFLDLPGLVQRGDVEAVEKAVAEAFDFSSSDMLAIRSSDLAATREKVADYFAACALSGETVGDLDGAAHITCCFETLERMLAGGDKTQPSSWRRAAWRVPLAQGVVVLPFEVPSRREASSGAELGFTAGLSSGAGSNTSGVTAPTSFIGDLIVLKQQLRRYELGEIAHVENVLAKEHLDRTHRSLRRTESKLLAVEDIETETATDLQSTTRDDLNSEIQKTIAEQLDLSVNFNVSASYMGPAMTVAANVGGAAGYRRASEERAATATAHSHEVVSRASQRVRERTLTQRESIETSESEETAAHGFENDTSDHIVGVYRWLERCFDLQLVNYGRRQIFEFVVPEPSSYWSALVSARGNAKSGPPPAFPELATNSDAETTRSLAPDDFTLRTADGAALDRPARWTEIVKLAGAWGVALEPVPRKTVQVHFALNAPGEASPPTAKGIVSVGNNVVNHYTSGSISTVASTKPLTIPEGYRATEGHAALKGWMYLRPTGDTYHGLERGEAHLELSGRDYAFITEGGHHAPAVRTPHTSPPGIQALPDGRAQIEFKAQSIIAPGSFIEGEIPVLLTTTFNGLTCSIRLECTRTDAHGQAWSERMYALFAAAHAARLAQYEDDKSRALLGNDDWAGAMPAATARAIEQRELKRAVLSAITNGSLKGIGDAAFQPSSDGNEPEPTVPVVKPGSLPAYERIVRFFELAFDWNNLAYMFSPYFYGRRKEWTRLAVADNADAQFKAFLSAGAARVQVPVRLGYEAHVAYLFDGIGLPSLEDRVPWLTSMRPIAEDLAANAREGFDIGAGRVTVASGSDVVTGDATVFRDPQDLDREIRLGGQIYVIREVHSATQVVISPAYKGNALTKSAYELGGIVVGPSFPLKLPTTLVAIDKEGLTLPTYPARYGA